MSATEVMAGERAGEGGRRLLRRAALVLLLLFALRWCHLYVTVFAGRWATDFVNWWAAGRVWLEGGFVYGPEFTEAARRVVTSFDAPFFYPPTILPVLAPLGLMAPTAGAQLLFALQLAAMLGTIRLLWGLQRDRGMAFHPVATLACLFLAVALASRPAVAVAVFGQLQILLAFGFALWLWGRSRGEGWAEAAGLAILLLKPQFGIGLWVWSALTPGARRAAVLSAAATLGLFGVAAVPGQDPVALVLGFLGNLGAYGEFEVNDPVLSPGAGFVLGSLGLGTGAAVTLTAVTGTALLLRRAGVADPFVVGGLLVGVAIGSSSSHDTDFVMLAPLAVVALGPLGWPRRVAMAAGFVLLLRSWEVVEAFDGTVLGGLPGLFFTVGLLLVLVPVALPRDRAAGR